MSERVVAAVPAFNAGEHLLYLAQQLNEQPFDEVYILDDSSTDSSVQKLQRQFAHFQVISGTKNIGPAGNRNRLLQCVTDGIILFVDADMRLASKNIPSAVTATLGQASVGMVGGYIMNKQGNPMGWNYGFEMHPRKDAWFGQLTSTLARPNLPEDIKNELIAQLQAADANYHWVRPQAFPLRRRTVDWVAEGLFAIRAATFRKVGGYDERMDYHEGQDLARRVRDLGLGVVVAPGFRATHQELDVRGEQRGLDFRESQFYFFQKHWGMSWRVFDALYGSS